MLDVKPDKPDKPDKQDKQSVRRIVIYFQKEKLLNENFEKIDKLLSPFSKVTASQTPVESFYQILRDVVPELRTITASDAVMVLRESPDKPLEFLVDAWAGDLNEPDSQTYALVGSDWKVIERQLQGGLYIGTDTMFSSQFEPVLPVRNLKSGDELLPQITVISVVREAENSRVLLVFASRKRSRKANELPQWLDYTEQANVLNLVARRLGEAHGNAINTEQYQHFTQDVMHQLNNSFGALAFEVENLKEGVIPSEEYPTAFRRLFEITQVFRKHIETGVASARGIGLLEIYGDATRILKPDDVLDMLRRNAEFFVGKAERYQIDGPQIVESSFSELPLIKVYPELFNLVLFNLLDNAMKYSVQYANLPVTVEASLEGDWVKISVTNHGIRVTEEDREYIFQRYKRSQTAKGHASFGTGIGLYLCNEIMGLHSGSIEVSPSAPSTLDNRADEVTFTLYLPISESRRLTTTQTELAINPDQPTVLFVEDDQWEMEGLLRNLQLEFNVIAARNFEHARSRLIAYHDLIDIVLLDIRLKDPNLMGEHQAAHAGIDFARWVLQDNQIDIPIVVHTGNVTQQMESDLFDVGVKEIVKKGAVSGGDIRAVLNRYIKGTVG